MELQVKDLESVLGIQMKVAMKADLSKMCHDVTVKAFLHMASMLDPRFKSFSFLSKEDKEAN